jgi:cellulose synthase/poly-beta-1,6-N-acetylglucosamine synthase-like glycosyltransferase
MGLCMIKNEIQCDAVLVMDADGVDRPQDVIRLLNCFRENSESIVFAGRRKRFESITFRAGCRGCWPLIGMSMTFVQARDYRIFAEGVETLWSQAEAKARWMVAS